MSPRFASIPADRADVHSVSTEDGLSLRLYHLHGPRTARPVLLFGHACSFSAGSYLPLLASLTELADVFAFDARGHGGSDAPVSDLSLYTPDHFARDLVPIARAAGRLTADRPVTYVGHSLGAAVLLRLGGRHADVFRQVPWRGFVLFEPPIFPSTDRPEHAEALNKDRALIERTASRRARWPSREAFIEAVAGRGWYRGVRREFLVAHAAAALRPARDGDGYELCCPPAVETAAYKGFSDDSTYRALHEFPRDLPLHLVAGDASDPVTRSWVTLIAPVLAERLGLPRTGRGARRFTTVPGRGHLMIQEDPEMTRALIHDSLASFWNP